MKLIYWSDYACPYCYIGEARLKKAIDEVKRMPEYSHWDVEMEMKAFQLDPSAGDHAAGDTQTRFARKYGISMQEAAKTIEHISQMGIAEGLDFKYATTLFTNTMDAHRLTKLAWRKNDPILYERLIEALFAAYFTDNQELADQKLLQKIGEDAGLATEEVKEVLTSDKYRDEVLLDEREAARYGIHAVPYFVVGQYGISGAQSVQDMKATLLRALASQSEPVMAQGASCGPDGCPMG